MAELITAVSKPAPWIRTFHIDGQETTSRTYRTDLVEHFTEIRGRTFLDLGASDGYESRAVALRGARRVLSVEAKDGPFAEAISARDYLQIANQEVLKLDARFINAHGLGIFDVVLCFGLVYHLANPFNFLKRVRCVTRDLLLLETHVAPRTLVGLRKKHVSILPFEMHHLEMDGVPFEGKFVRHQGEFARSKGSVDSPWSFWLTQEALVKALVRSGFQIVHFHHELDSQCPEPVGKWGSLLGFGHQNTKVWVVASPRGDVPEVVERPVERVIQGDPAWADNVLRAVRRRYLWSLAPE